MKFQNHYLNIKFLFMKKMNKENIYFSDAYFNTSKNPL